MWRVPAVFRIMRISVCARRESRCSFIAILERRVLRTPGAAGSVRQVSWFGGYCSSVPAEMYAEGRDAASGGVFLVPLLFYD